MMSRFAHVRPAAFASLAIACAMAGCSGSGGTGSAVLASAPGPSPSASAVPTPTPLPSASPTASPAPSPAPTVAPSTTCNFEGPIISSGPGPNNTFHATVAVGPGNREGVSITNVRMRFGFVNTSFVSASTPPPPTTFDSSNLTWTIGSLPLNGTAQYTLVLTFTQLPPELVGGTTFMQVHEQTSSDQCAAMDVDAFETNE
jgi:hypothetical protein